MPFRWRTILLLQTTAPWTCVAPAQLCLRCSQPCSAVQMQGRSGLWMPALLACIGRTCWQSARCAGSLHVVRPGAEASGSPAQAGVWGEGGRQSDAQACPGAYMGASAHMPWPAGQCGELADKQAVVPLLWQWPGRSPLRPMLSVTVADLLERRASSWCEPGAEQRCSPSLYASCGTHS